MSATDVTHRRIVAIAGPIILANITVPLLGLADTAVIGQIGSAVPIASVAIGSVILSALYWAFGFLRMGTTGLTGQAAGQGDMLEVSALFKRGVLIGAVAGLALMLLQIPFFAAAFTVSPADPEVEALARRYMQIRMWSAPAAIMLYAVSGWLIARERTRGLLVQQIVTNGLNIMLDIVFVLWLDFGVEGVAGASVIAEYSGLALGLWLCRDTLRLRVGQARIFDPQRLRRMAAVNTDIMLRTFALQAMLVVLMFQGAGFGAVTLAANQILMQFIAVIAFGLDGFAFAAETLVGQAAGQRDKTALHRAAVMSSLWGAGVALATGAGFALFGPAAISVMTTAPDVRAAAALFLPFVIAAPVLGLPAWMLDGIFIGATRTKDMRNMMIVSLLFYLAVLWPLTAVFGNYGLWSALCLSWIARAVTLGLYYPALRREV